MSIGMAKKSDLLQGTLDLLVLKALAHGPLHGLAVSHRIAQITQGTFRGPARLALPGFAPDGGGGLAQRHLGRIGKQPARQILSAHARGPAPVPGRSAGLEADRNGHRWSFGERLIFMLGRRFFYLLRNLGQRSQVERELKEELAHAEAVLTEQARQTGLSEAEAARSAALALGGMEQLKEQVREERAGFGLEKLCPRPRLRREVVRQKQVVCPDCHPDDGAGDRSKRRNFYSGARGFAQIASLSEGGEAGGGGRNSPDRFRDGGAVSQLPRLARGTKGL